MCKKLIYLISIILTLTLSHGYAQDLIWDRTAYWDARYPSAWGGDGEGMRDALEAAGYTILDADELKTWMDARIADRVLSVVVFCKDVVPDTVGESMSADCTIRRYLDAGGKVVWYSDWPFYYQGVNLTNVDKIAIGLGTKSGMAAPGGSGTVYIDDIRLYR